MAVAAGRAGRRGSADRLEAAQLDGTRASSKLVRLRVRCRRRGRLESIAEPWRCHAIDLGPALEVATVALVREATLRRFMIAKGLATAEEFEAFRSANITLIAAEAKQTLAKEIEKAMRAEAARSARGRAGGDLAETATRLPIDVDALAETALRPPPKK